MSVDQSSIGEQIRRPASDHPACPVSNGRVTVATSDGRPTVNQFHVVNLALETAIINDDMSGVGIRSPTKYVTSKLSCVVGDPSSSRTSAAFSFASN